MLGFVGASPVRVLGRYALYGEIAAGGMATVHFGRLLGQVGFSRTVAIKRLHPQFAKDPEFVSMFLDEARIAARVRHPNVVATIDIVATEGELFLVMDYVQGESLTRLIRLAKQLGERVPPRIVVAILVGVLHGLHAAHEAKNERGEPLELVHRDVSPHNVLVGIDGISRVLDFGVAKAAGRLQTTREGRLKGKIAYMAPEQFKGVVSRQTDVYAAGIVAWEALTGDKLFAAADELETLGRAMTPTVEPPSVRAPGVPVAFDAVLAKALTFEPAGRYATAREMALELEKCAGTASTSEVGEWVERLAKTTLNARADVLGGIESSSPDFAMDSKRLASVLGETVGEGSSPAIAPPSVPSVAGVAQAGASRVSIEMPKRSRALPAAAIVVGLVLAGLVGWRITSVASRDANAPSPTNAPVAPPEPNPPPAVSPPSATADASATPSPTASESASAASSSPIAATTAPRHASHAAAAHPGAAKAKRGDCDPPYTLDASGRKHYKVDCL